MRKCKLLFIVLVLGLLSPVMATPYYGWQSDYVAPQPASTLYLWNMENAYYHAGPPQTMDDVITGANNALTFGTTGGSRTASGKWGYGVNLPGGTTGTDEFYAKTTTDFASDASLSVECWAKSSDGIPHISSTVNNVDWLACKSAGFYNGAGNGFVMMFNEDKAGSGLFFRGGIGTTAGNAFAQKNVADANILPGFNVMNWNHYALTWDAEIDTFRLYINGIKVGEMVLSGGAYIPNTDKALHVGQRALSGYGTWSGDIDNVRLSNVAYEYAVPEPATIALLVCGGSILMIRRRRA